MIRKTTILCVLFMAVAVIASAQDTVQLQLKGEQGRIMKYEMGGGGVLNFVLDGFPVPNSKISGENIKADVALDAYFDTLEVGDDYVSYSVKAVLDNVTLGGLMQLPGMDGLGGAPELTLELNSLGGIENISIHNLKLPGGDMLKGMLPGMDNTGMDMTSLDSIMPMVIGLIPPIFPEDPVAVGDKWVRKTNTEEMPLPIFPVFEFRYKLDAIEDGIAKIIFRSVGDYDAGFINNFLSMVPQIPMGDDEMSVDHVDLKLDWDLQGTMDFNIEKGQILNINTEGVVNLNAKGDLTFTHADGASEPWTPIITGDLKIHGKLNYVEDMARADYELMFPPAPEEDETSGEAVEGESADENATIPEDLPNPAKDAMDDM